MVQLVSRLKVVEIPIKDVVINAIETMAEDQGFKSLENNKNKNK